MENGYLLDTDVWVEYFHNRNGVKEKLQQYAFSDIFVSEISIAELYYGALHSKNVEKHLKEVYELEDTFEVVPISECLMDYAEMRNNLSVNGLSVGQFDLLIGATARHFNLTMVTHNVKHFQKLQGLTLEDWIIESDNN